MKTNGKIIEPLISARMKEILLILTATICLITSMDAQHHNQDENEDYIQSLKIAHITQKLQLTPRESEKFWPVYNEYRNRSDLRRSRYYSLRDREVDNDEDANQIIEKMLELDAKRTADKKIFYETLRQVISPIKVIKLSKAEHEFKKEILKRIRQPSEGEG